MSQITFNFQCIYQQPIPIETFCYDSYVKKNNSLECEFVFCNGEDIPNIWIGIDLYAELNPPCLSPHCIKKKQNKSNNNNIIVDVMERVSKGYYRYRLENCYIQKVSNKKKLRTISKKLHDLQTWQNGTKLKEYEMDYIENIISMDYSDKQFEEKVYIGFTPYVHDAKTDRKKALDCTTFTEPIFNSMGSCFINPCYGPITGGTVHTVKLSKNIELPYKVNLKLSDAYEHWQTVIEGDASDGLIRFMLPPYNEICWSGSDETQLVYLEILDVFVGVPKDRLMFVYKK